MNKQVVSLYLLVALFLLVVPVISVAEMPPDGIYFVRSDSTERETLDFRPEYLTDETLVFYSCIEGAKKVFNSVYCKDEVTAIHELTSYPWKDGCFISMYDLNDTTCSQLVVMAEYEYKDEILKQTKEIVVRDVDSIPYTIIDAQDSDGGWGDPVSTGWVLWALSEFNDDDTESFENNSYASIIEAGLRWLKENRNEDGKCWPAENCSIKTTAEVLGLLKEADFTNRKDWLRVVYDAAVWISLQQNLFNLRDPQENDVTDDKWSAYITGVNWTDGSIPIDYSSCLIKYGNELDLTMQVVFGKQYQINFTPIHDEKFNIVCTPNSLPLAIRNSRRELMYNATSANVSYHIPGACWDDVAPWNFCDVATTNFASLAQIDGVRKALAVDWLNSRLTKADTGNYYNTSNEVFDTSWFLYERFANDAVLTTVNDGMDKTETEDKIIKWLLYNQNNDGSWGNSSAADADKIIPTAMASIALTKLNNGSYTEYIKDANLWISQMKPVDGWDTIQKDAISFLAFSRSAKPFLKSDKKIILMSSNQLEVELYNPSSFNFNHLTFELSDSLEDIISIDEIGSIASDYYKPITLHMNGSITDPVFGYISIKDDNYEIAKLPVLVQAIPEISIKLTKPSISIYNGKGTVSFTVDKSAGSELDCSLAWDDSTITSKKKFLINKQKSISTDIVLSQIKNQDVVYTGRLDCMYNSVNISNSFSLQTNQFEDIPYTVTPNNLNITDIEEKPTFTIFNNVNREITLTIEFESEDPYLFIDTPQVVIEPLGSVDVSVSNFMPENESVFWDNVIQVKGYDRVENVLISVNYIAEQRSSLFGSFFTFLLVFGVLGGIGYALYAFRGQVISMLPDAIKSKIPEAIMPSPTAAGGAGKAAFSFSFGKKKDSGPEHPLEKKVNSKNFVHVAEVIKIMKGLGQDDDSISKRLQAEGYTKGEVNELFKRVTEEMDVELSLEKEEKFMKLMKGLEQDVGTVRNKLKQDGFTDLEIKEAFKQAEDEIQKKRDILDKKIKDESKYDITKDEAAAAAADGGDSGDAGDSYKQKDAKEGDKKEEKK